MLLKNFVRSYQSCCRVKNIPDWIIYMFQFVSNHNHIQRPITINLYFLLQTLPFFSYITVMIFYLPCCATIATKSSIIGSREVHSRFFLFPKQVRAPTGFRQSRFVHSTLRSLSLWMGCLPTTTVSGLSMPIRFCAALGFVVASFSDWSNLATPLRSYGSLLRQRYTTAHGSCAKNALPTQAINSIKSINISCLGRRRNPP